MIDRFDHLCIHPTDFDLSLAFYRDTLGWAVVEDREDAMSGRNVTLSGGAARVVLSERPPSGVGPLPGSPMIHLDIHDIDGRYRELPPGNHVVLALEESSPGKGRFVVRDPDGVLISFEGLIKARA